MTILVSILNKKYSAYCTNTLIFQTFIMVTAIENRIFKYYLSITVFKAE